MLCLNHFGISSNEPACTAIWEKAFEGPFGTGSLNDNAVAADIQLDGDGTLGQEDAEQEGAISCDRHRPLKEACRATCPRKCSISFSSDDRLGINKQFWAKSPSEQLQFMADYVTRKETTRKTKGKLAHSRRTYTNEYHFKKASEHGGGLHQVCKRFFLATLGFKGDNSARVLTALNKRREISSIENVQDLRGRHAPKHKLSHESRRLVVQHISAFHPQVHHYRRAHAPHRRYLPCEMSIAGMFADFCQTHPTVQIGYSSYIRVFRDENISFAKLGNEECDVCSAHKLHMTTAHPLGQPQPDVCDHCYQHAVHVENFVRAREWYAYDQTRELEASELVVSADMQKVVVLPIIRGSKACIFAPRLVAYNETFANVNDKVTEKKTLAVLWHEAITGRSASDVACAFFAFLKVSLYIYLLRLSKIKLSLD